jgi:LysM repeat protein
MSCPIIEYQRDFGEIMKRLLFAFLTGGALTASSLFAQNEASPATAQAQKEYIEEAIKSLNTTVEGIAASQAAMHKRLSALERELAQLRDEAAKRPNNVVTRDELKPLEEKLIEINKKREDDKRLILEKLEQLAKIPPPLAPHRATPAANGSERSDKPDKPEKGYEYDVKPGDSLSTIVAAYRQQGIKVTLDQVLKANPNLKPGRLLPGQKIFIPDPAQN